MYRNLEYILFLSVYDFILWILFHLMFCCEVFWHVSTLTIMDFSKWEKWECYFPHPTVLGSYWNLCNIHSNKFFWWNNSWDYCDWYDESLFQLIVFQEHPDYDKDRCHAFLCDISSENPDFPFPKESLDIIVLIFVLSAIDPSKYVPLNYYYVYCHIEFVDFKSIYPIVVI